MSRRNSYTIREKSLLEDLSYRCAKRVFFVRRRYLRFRLRMQCWKEANKIRFVTDIYNSRTECGGRRILHELLKCTYLWIRFYAVLLGDIRGGGGGRGFEYTRFVTVIKAMQIVKGSCNMTPYQ